MKAKVLMIGSAGGRWRAKSRIIFPASVAIIVHFLLLAIVLSWKPPLTTSLNLTEVSLISSVGLGKTLALQQPVEMKSTPPTPIAAEPTSIQSQTINSTPPLISTPAIQLKPLDDIAPDALNLAFGPSSLTTQPIPLSSPPQPPTANPAPPLAGDNKCQILEMLKSSLQTSDKAQMALSAIPREDRSVANAILLWNGRWIDQSSVGGKSILEPIETVVLESVSAAPANCQREVLNGPRLITLEDRQDTIVLAFGSGTWRWADLLAMISPFNLK